MERLIEEVVKDYDSGKGLQLDFVGLLVAFLLFFFVSMVNSQTSAKMIYHQRLIFVKMQINQTAEGLFLLDTGASASAIDIKTAEKLKLLIVGNDKVEGTAGTIQVNKSTVKSLSINQVKVKNLTFPTYDLSGILTPPGMKVEGILGYDFLRHFTVKIDYPNQTVEFSKQRLKPDSSTTSVLILLDNGIPRLSAVLNENVNTEFRLDTAASLFQTSDIYLNITEKVWNTLTALDSTLKPDQYFTGSGVGGSVRLPVSRIKRLQVGKISFNSPFVIVQPKVGYFAREDAVGFVSNNFLDKFGVVTIDYPNRKLLLQSLKNHTTTEWNLAPSFKFDTLCFLNTLTGDEYYLGFYKDEFAKFESKLTPSAKTALANLKRKIKDQNKNIISAFLTLYFSATDDETLDEMLKTLKDSRKMQTNLWKTQFYSEGSWKMFESVKEDLQTIFKFLKEIKFEKYWKESILPKVQQRIAKIQGQLPKFNIIPEIENILGFALPSNKITVFMLFYSQPHGIRITGTRFLTDIAWSFSIVLRNAVHEMMHPPFDLKKDTELVETLNQLQKDEFLMDKILNHNPAFGYNSFFGFIEEDIVQSLEQIINEKLKIEREARARWKENDDGMHVFAVALYSLMKQENFPQNKESIRDFIVRMIKTGKFSDGKIKLLNDTLYK